MLGLSYTLHEIAQAIPARDLFQGFFPSPALQHLAYDSRRISHGEKTLFVALKTANRDGHEFIEAAMEKGVRHFIVDRPLPYPDINYLLVDDTLEALQLWAGYHRNRFTYPVIAITGSNGKTTIKEWLATLLEYSLQIVKSPMSHNSQLGVALSLLQMRPKADLALIEAGISQPGEMELLWEMIRPSFGILSHMGLAHAEGFESDEQKLSEKTRLFEEVGWVAVGTGQEEVTQFLSQKNIPLISIGEKELPESIYHLKLVQQEPFSDHWKIHLQEDDQNHELEIPLTGMAALENALIAILAARKSGISWSEIKSRLPLLYPVEMRTELISDNPDVSIINDSYNSDLDSIRNAFQMLKATEAQPRRCLILSDVLHQGQGQESLQRKVLHEAETLFGKENIWTVGPVYKHIRDKQSYADTQELIQHFRYQDVQHSTLLLKGARQFQLEKIIPLINRRLNASYLQVNLNALSHNLRHLKSNIPPHCKVMCMVKAFSYGSGTWETAQVLEQEGVDYLGVAFASEAIELRQKGLNLPIMVVNPDVSSLHALIEYKLEPQIINLDILQAYLRAARLAGLSSYPLHLKFDTGMGRLGFQEGQIEPLISLLEQYPDIQVISIASHLAAADDPSEDAFSYQQMASFDRLYQRLHEALGIQPLRHLLNTAGVLRFPEKAMEMVRLGIGLYGINPVMGADKAADNLQEVASLHALISQIHAYPAGTSIGYGRSEYTQRDSRIATLPIGYADGVLRILGNGRAHFLLHGKKVPTFGRICMDMLMLDVTDIPEAQAGDEVVIFGYQHGEHISVLELAEHAETIPYEILTRISSRVRRIYIRE